MDHHNVMSIASPAKPAQFQPSAKGPVAPLPKLRTYYAVTAGEILPLQGQLLISGQITITLNARVVDIRIPGEFIDYAGFMDGRNFQAVAQTDCTIVALDESQTQQLKSYPTGFVLQIVKTMVERLTWRH